MHEYILPQETISSNISNEIKWYVFPYFNRNTVYLKYEYLF